MKNFYAQNIIATVIAVSLYLPATFANAEEHPMEQMHDHGDNPIVTKIMLDKLELQNTNGANPAIVEAQAWIGKDLNKFWLKADVEKRNGKTEDAEIQALYSHAIATYWDVQMGMRQDIKPTPTRTWGVLGIQGLTPYFFDIDAALFIGEAGRTAARVSAKYDLLLTQYLIFSPELEINFYGQNDVAADTGSGLSDTKAGLRLRYEIRREFAPYIGVNWSRTYGRTADAANSQGIASSDASLVTGMQIWF